MCLKLLNIMLKTSLAILRSCGLPGVVPPIESHNTSPSKVIVFHSTRCACVMLRVRMNAHHDILWIATYAQRCMLFDLNI